MRRLDLVGAGSARPLVAGTEIFSFWRSPFRLARLLCTSSILSYRYPVNVTYPDRAARWVLPVPKGLASLVVGMSRLAAGGDVHQLSLDLYS